MLFEMGFQRERIASAMKAKKMVAYAKIYGDADHATIRGRVNFYSVGVGTLVEATVFGLPQKEGNCPGDVFAFHIHAGENCTGTAADPFADVKGHYNPKQCPHPAHAGDMPPLFGNRGYAWMAFYTDRFTPEEIVGKTAVIHADPDDFTSQPAGNAGKKIACGAIWPA